MGRVGKDTRTAVERQRVAPQKSAAGGGFRAIGQARADAYHVGVAALGSQQFTAVQLMQLIGEGDVQIVPQVQVTSGGASGELTEALLRMLVRQQAATFTANPNARPLAPATQPPDAAR